MPNSMAITMVDEAEKIVKFVPIDPTRAVRMLTLSASDTDSEVAICQTRPRFGSQVARTKAARLMPTANSTYPLSEKTCLSADLSTIAHFSLSAVSTMALRAA